MSSTNKIDHHEITEVLLKVAVYSINQPSSYLSMFISEDLLGMILWINVDMFFYFFLQKPKGGEKEGGDMFSPDKMVSF